MGKGDYQFEDVLITGLIKGGFGLLLSFLDGKPAGLIEFMPPSERTAIQVASE